MFLVGTQRALLYPAQDVEAVEPDVPDGAILVSEGGEPILEADGGEAITEN
jgi:hypothetical protein